MDIVIISEFCEDFSDTDNDRFLYIAKMLKDNPVNEVEIVTSNFRHTTKKHRNKPIEEWPIKITFIAEPGYPKNICLKRFVSHYIWGKNIIEYIRNRKKPNVIYCAVPSLTGPNKVAKYCEKNNIQFIIDVQDLWPEAFKMVFHLPILSNIMFFPLKKIADMTYKRADVIVGVSQEYVNRVLKVSKKNPKTAVLYIGTELETFDENVHNNYITKNNNKEIWLAYCGTLGNSYNIKLVINALCIIRKYNIRFIIMGDGPKEAEFRSYAKEKQIICSFMGRMPYDKMCGLLAASDIVVNPIVKTSVASIINKHADYAASGLPVINSQINREYRKLVENYNMGFNCDSPEEMAASIEILVNNPDLRKEMGANARRCAEELFDREKTYGKVKELLRQKDNYR